MGKLIKYEFRKQMFSKLVMAIIIGVLMLVFMYKTFSGQQEGEEAPIALLGMAMVFSMIYVALESLLVYEKDLSTRQSYMLFLVPQTSGKIMGSKMIAAVLHILLTIAMYAGAVLICFMVYGMKHAGVKEFFEELAEFLGMLLKTEVDIPYVLDVFGKIVIEWVLIVMMGMFAVTVIHTVLNKNKLGSFLAIVLYFVFFYLAAELSNLILGWNLNWTEFGETVFSVVYIVVLDVLLFLGTTWLMDKKLSV